MTTRCQPTERYINPDLLVLLIKIHDQEFPVRLNRFANARRDAVRDVAASGALIFLMNGTTRGERELSTQIHGKEVIPPSFRDVETLIHESHEEKINMKELNPLRPATA